jgi:hypothetical protein
MSSSEYIRLVYGCAYLMLWLKSDWEVRIELTLVLHFFCDAVFHQLPRDAREPVVVRMESVIMGRGI